MCHVPLLERPQKIRTHPTDLPYILSVMVNNVFTLLRLSKCHNLVQLWNKCTVSPSPIIINVGFYGLRGLSIGVMVFILYKLYVLLPYTYPTPKLSPHWRRCISTFPQKNLLCMIYKRFKLWGHWKCPHKSPSHCNTYVIPMSLYTFVSS